MPNSDRTEWLPLRFLSYRWGVISLGWWRSTHRGTKWWCYWMFTTKLYTICCKEASPNGSTSSLHCVYFSKYSFVPHRQPCDCSSLITKCFELLKFQSKQSKVIKCLSYRIQCQIREVNTMFMIVYGCYVLERLLTVTVILAVSIK